MPKIFQLDNLWAVFFFLLSLSLFTRLISTIDIDLRLLLVLRISLNFLSFSFFFLVDDGQWSFLSPSISFQAE